MDDDANTAAMRLVDDGTQLVERDRLGVAPVRVRDLDHVDAARALATRLANEVVQRVAEDADGVVGPQTWAALPDGRPMPWLKEGSSGEVVKSLQRVLTNGAPGAWNVTPQGLDGSFGPHTKASLKAFQTWGGVTSDGIVGDQTWSVSLHAASATLESAVGLNFVVD